VFLDGNNAFNTTLTLIEDSFSSTSASQLEHFKTGDAGAGEARLDKIIQQSSNKIGPELLVVFGLLECSSSRLSGGLWQWSTLHPVAPYHLHTHHPTHRMYSMEKALFKR